ncbi:hypothetical protein SELMODRAFT_428574 [Selaginella moellendorffii]|uniref:Pentatricopeptide repeat-containing protein n=1 Tax=Selaginella moellendorffii TaxID=88036 RepID=D8T3A9_SELML|nr:hypothetical protein SELMODRAFT_428574 [Selaginella moellendorffii]
METYGKCGRAADALGVLHKMEDGNVFFWNAFAHSRQMPEVLVLFRQMLVDIEFLQLSMAMWRRSSNWSLGRRFDWDVAPIRLGCQSRAHTAMPWFHPMQVSVQFLAEEDLGDGMLANGAP